MSETPEERTRSVQFLRSLAVRTAGRTHEVPCGVVILNDPLPLVWDLNFLWLDSVPEGLTAQGLADEAERLLGGAGLGHRQIVVADERGSDGLAPGLEALGWSSAKHAIMVHRRPPDRPVDLALARRLDLAEVRAFCEGTLRENPTGFTHEAILQLSTQKDVAAADGARFLGVDVEGVVASACDLYVDGGVAQIEAVITLERFRNRGLARAVVLAALAEARTEGCDLVFLLAEWEDWPRQLYRRLGFDTVGSTLVLRRARA